MELQLEFDDLPPEQPGVETFLAHRKSGVHHYWDGWDTACRMHSTGGIPSLKNYTTVRAIKPARLCPMCSNSRYRNGFRAII